MGERAEDAASVEPRVVDHGEAERRRAFERFTQSRLERAYRLAGVLVRDRYEAEDAVHDAAVQAWLHWSDLRDQARMDAWFDRIVVNECRARMRRRTIQLLEVMGETERPSPDISATIVERDRLRGALAGLDVDHRIAVVLRYLADLTPAEIAARTGQREGTVKSRLHYALRELHAALDAGERASGGAR